METVCNRCGKCCEAICLSYSPEYLKNNDSKEAIKILSIFNLITEKEALEINPYLQVWVDKGIRDRFFILVASMIEKINFVRFMKLNLGCVKIILFMGELNFLLMKSFIV